MEIDARPSPSSSLVGWLPPERVGYERRESVGVDDWDVVRERLTDRWPILTPDELDATHGRAELLTALLQAKLIYAQRLAEESVGHSLRPNRAAKGTGLRDRLSMLGLSALSVVGFFFVALYL